MNNTRKLGVIPGKLELFQVRQMKTNLKHYRFDLVQVWIIILKSLIRFNYFI